MTPDEFENRWAEMVLKYNVSDNKHLQDLYDIRASFVLAYFKNRFFPFLQTTARSEDFNAVLKRYVSPHNSLFHFFEQYMKLQESIDLAVDSNEFKDEDKILRMWGEWPIEEHAFNVYTMPIYLRFRAEIRKVTCYNVNLLDGQQFNVVPVTGYVYGYGKRSYRVEANLSEGIYNCDVQEIPDHYIIPRWRIPPDDIVPEKVELPHVPVDKKLTNKERKLLRKSYSLADKYMRELGKELSAIKISAASKRNEKRKQTKKQGEPSGAENVGDDGQGSNTQYQHVRDPIMTTTKGRPEEKRKKSGLHLKASKPVECKACGSAQHSTAECPSKISTVPEQKEINFFRDMI
nr:protein FAR1-RELATED SEQUENCE 11-like [Lolium perenne]